MPRASRDLRRGPRTIQQTATIRGYERKELRCRILSGKVASFDQKTIEVVGSKGSDHYIVVVGRSGGANGRIKLGKPAYEYADVGPASGWGADAIAVDVWEANRSGEGLPAVPATKNRYTMEENGQYVLFCSMAPANRQAHKGV